MKYIRYILLIFILFGCATSNYKYNKKIKQRNEITTALIKNKPIDKTPIWDYIAVTGLFIILVILINSQ